MFLRLCEAERRVLEEDAERHALSMTEYLRRLIVGAHLGKVAVPGVNVMGSFYTARSRQQ